MPELNLSVNEILGLGLSFKLDGFRLVYSLVCTFMWVCSFMLSKQYFQGHSNNRRYYIFALVTYFATMGVFLSGDMYTTFCFFEVMSIASYVMVVQTESAPALRAAGTYLAVAVIGGLVMLMGVFMLYDLIGTLSYENLSTLCGVILHGNDPFMIKKLYVAGFLILFGFGAKAGMYPLHIWLPKAHPVAPAPASALLSGILTKSGLFGVLVLCLEVFKNDDTIGLAIYCFGLATMVTGAVIALFSVDLKRTLACSSVSQIGFILVGIALTPLLKEESTLAITGAVLYMFNHSMFKLCLFLGAGAVYMIGHKLDLNDIRGVGRNMKAVRILFAVGTLGISGVPLFSGYISKTLIHEAILEYVHLGTGLSTLFKVSEWVFLISGGMTFAYMLKLFFAVFIEKPVTDTAKSLSLKAKEKKTSVLSIVAIGLPAFVISFMGLFPNIFMNRIGRLLTTFNTFKLSEEGLEILEGIKIFSLENLKGSLTSLAIGACIYILIIRKLLMKKKSDGVTEYVNRWPAFLDIEEKIYRPLLLNALPKLMLFIFNSVIKLTKAVFYGILRFKFFDFIIIVVKAVYKGIFYTGRLIADVFGRLVDMLLGFISRHVLNDFVSKDHPVIGKMKAKLVKFESRERDIASSVSASVFLVSVGLCFTIIYLLYLLFM